MGNILPGSEPLFPVFKNLRADQVLSLLPGVSALLPVSVQLVKAS